MDIEGEGGCQKSETLSLYRSRGPNLGGRVSLTHLWVIHKPRGHGNWRKGCCQNKTLLHFSVKCSWNEKKCTGTEYVVYGVSKACCKKKHCQDPAGAYKFCCYYQNNVVECIIINLTYDKKGQMGQSSQKLQMHFIKNPYRFILKQNYPIYLLKVPPL